MGHIMKRKLSKLSRRYAAALRKHLKQGPEASLQPARGLGCKAVSLGLETLDVARIHAEALARLEAASSRNGIIKRAEIFFAEAVTPIEKTHGAARKASLHLRQLNKTLSRRTVDLASTNRSLKQSIGRRKTVEQALQKSGGDAEKLLEESRRLQKHLQHLTHRIMAAQEDKRKKISHELQDEIAQTLLGINVRLLTLKKEAAVNDKRLKKHIANTQLMVDKSVKGIKRFAREFGKDHEA
jgi:signal transduction histidine kinase